MHLGVVTTCIIAEIARAVAARAGEQGGAHNSRCIGMCPIPEMPRQCDPSSSGAVPAGFQAILTVKVLLRPFRITSIRAYVPDSALATNSRSCALLRTLFPAKEIMTSPIFRPAFSAGEPSLIREISAPPLTDNWNNELSPQIRLAIHALMR
jgi:hypothetical protein